MKIRIIENGWAGYTGMLGYVEFVDGVSVEDVSRGDAGRLGAIVQVESVEDGTNPSVAQQILDSRAFEMKSQTLSTGTDEKGEKIAAEDKVYDQAELEAIADVGGIKALRVIADPKDIKAQSIQELISKILDSQKPPEAPVVTKPVETLPSE